MATIRGNGFNNNLRGTSGNDFIYGEGGDDRLFGSAGADTMDGGRGIDTVDYSAALKNTNMQVEAGGWVIPIELTGVWADLEWGGLMGEAAGDTYIGIENVVGSGFDDAIRGNDYANTLSGGAGDDRIEGRGGADILDGGTGFDMLAYGSSTAFVKVDLQNSTATGGDATGDTFRNFEGLVGSEFGDYLAGNSSGNTIIGGGGNDRIDGRGGADILNGEAGNDTLIGGSGNDTLTGGTGADTFVFIDAGTDTITDLSAGDIIQIHSATPLTAVYDGGTHTAILSYTTDFGTAGTIVIEDILANELPLVTVQLI